MKTFIKKHWIGVVGAIVILTGLAIAIIFQHLRPGMICALVGLVILLIDLLINNDDKVPVSTPQSDPQSDTSPRDRHYSAIDENDKEKLTAQYAWVKLTKNDFVLLAVVMVFVLIALLFMS